MNRGEGLLRRGRNDLRLGKRRRALELWDEGNGGNELGKRKLEREVKRVDRKRVVREIKGYL